MSHETNIRTTHPMGWLLKRESSFPRRQRAAFDDPRDGEQIAREGFLIPNQQRTRNEIAKYGWLGAWRLAESPRHRGPRILPEAI